MQPGIFAKIFARPSVDEVFDAVARLHLRCVQFNFACAGLPSLPENVTPETCARIRKSAAAHRIAIAAVSGTFNVIHPDAAQRRDGLRKLGIIAAACESIGTGLITLCTGTRDPQDMWRPHPDNDSPEAWRDLMVAMTKALTIADKHSLTLGIEPELGNVINSAAKARRLLDEMRSPRLKIILDAANLIRPDELGRMDEVLGEAFDLLGGDLALAHAKELAADGHAGGLALGTGTLDWDRYLSLLQTAGFTGPLIMHGFEERDAAASVKFLRGKLASETKG
jgi:sugar phosphate isomerase/epimerase